MITRFFNTSRPIHFVLVAFYSLITFVFIRRTQFESGFDVILMLKEIALFGIVLFSIFILDFFSSKNNLTQKNNFIILIFCLFFALIPNTLKHANILLSNLCVLFALRRLLSLKSNLRVKKKLFDAAFWIAIASLFYFWSILFFILVIAALVFYGIGQVKNWIVPLIGVLTVVLLVISYNITWGNTFGDFSQYFMLPSFDFSSYNNLSFIISITIFITLSLWATFYYFKMLNDKSRSQKPSFILVFIAVLISMTIVIIVPNKSGSEFIFIFAPMVIIMTNYIESLKNHWFAEVFVWLLTITPIAVGLIL